MTLWLCAALAGTWLLWILVHLVLMAAVKPHVPAFTGFRIVIPPWVFDRLSHDELQAIVEHERGHRHHRHVWKNFALVCVFRRASTARRRRQELEADDFAAERVGPTALASALRRIADDEFDRLRAARLEDDWFAGKELAEQEPGRPG